MPAPKFRTRHRRRSNEHSGRDIAAQSQFRVASIVPIHSSQKVLGLALGQSPHTIQQALTGWSFDLYQGRYWRRSSKLIIDDQG
jgi:hypothetical protein